MYYALYANVQCTCIKQSRNLFILQIYFLKTGNQVTLVCIKDVLRKELHSILYRSLKPYILNLYSTEAIILTY